MTKSDFVKIVAEKGFLWSYKIDNLDNFPDAILIEQVLRYGDVPEIMQLFRLFDDKKIKKVWIEKLLPDNRLKAHNYYLARVFFYMDEPEKFFEQNKPKTRYERIKKLID